MEAEHRSIRAGTFTRTRSALTLRSNLVLFGESQQLASLPSLHHVQIEDSINLQRRYGNMELLPELTGKSTGNHGFDYLGGGVEARNSQ